MNRRMLAAYFIFALQVQLALYLIPSTYAEEIIDEDTGVRRYGVVHNIAEDRKVEKIGGTYEPEGLDKYLKRRLDEVNSKIDKLSQGVQVANQKIDLLTAQQESGKKT